MTERSKERVQLAPEKRDAEVTLTIDPGFVHHRLIQTLIGPAGMACVDREIAQLPPVPSGLQEVRIDHIYTKYLLVYCKARGVPSLEVVARTPNLNLGVLYCSTDGYTGFPEIYTAARGEVSWIPDVEDMPEITLQFSCSRVRSDTLKGKLRKGERLSVIAQLESNHDGKLVFSPLVIGFPFFASPDQDLETELMWLGYELYEQFIDDIDEFSKVKDIPTPETSEEMKLVSEASFKRCLARILGGTPPSDWGGERSDFYSAHIHIRGRRTTAAFLLKGPAKFGPMDMTYCGKKADQIFRLAQEPAQLLVLQHCHEVLPAVRAHVRAFAVTPVNPRRYCIIDGRDSLRLLIAYNLLAEAQEK